MWIKYNFYDNNAINLIEHKNTAEHFVLKRLNIYA